MCYGSEVRFQWRIGIVLFHLVLGFGLGLVLGLVLVLDLVLVLVVVLGL